MIDFREAYAVWLRTKAESFADKSKEELDDMVTELYDVWLKTPQDAFNGKAPMDYFDSYDSEALVDALLAYAQQRVPIPDPLCDAIMEEQACVPLLLDALDEPLTAQQNQAVLERLSEMQEERMIEPCMRLVLGQDDVKADQAEQAILLFGQPVAKLALIQLEREGLSDKVLDRLADIVAVCGPCQGAYQRLCTLLTQRTDARAFFAQCLAKTGDERALPILIQIAKHPQLAYYDYIAIRDAVEELGGELVDSREFSGDRDYMILKERDD